MVQCHLTHSLHSVNMCRQLLLLGLLLLQILTLCSVKPDIESDPNKSNLSLEQMLIGLKTSPPQTAADFLASFVSHYGVPIFRGPYQPASLSMPIVDNNSNCTNCETIKMGNQSGLSRQYWSEGEEVISVWIAPKSKGQSIENESSSQLVSVSMRDIARTANCEPEMQTVHLSRLQALSSVAISGGDAKRDLYFPHCIRLPRCGGCCPSERLRCTAQHVKRENVMVMHVKYSDREHRFQFYGIKQVPVERHLQCACECIQRDTDCLPGQQYRKDECRCICPTERRVECLHRQQRFTIHSRFLIWNETHCECQCRPPTMQRCQIGFRFNHSSCRCEAMAASKASWALSGVPSKRAPVPTGPRWSRYSVWLQPNTAGQRPRSNELPHRNAAPFNHLINPGGVQ